MGHQIQGVVIIPTAVYRGVRVVCTCTSKLKNKYGLEYEDIEIPVTDCLSVNRKMEWSEGRRG